MAQVGNADGASDLTLLKDEVGGLMWEYGISTVTFFKGERQHGGLAAAMRMAHARSTPPTQS